MDTLNKCPRCGAPKKIDYGHYEGAPLIHICNCLSHKGNVQVRHAQLKHTLIAPKAGVVVYALQ